MKIKGFFNWLERSAKKTTMTATSLVLAVLMIISVFTSLNIAFPISADAAVSQTEYSDLADYQKKEMAKIQSKVFKGKVSSTQTDPKEASEIIGDVSSYVSSIAYDTDENKNDYFNWTKTSGLTLWNGKPKTLVSSGTEKITYSDTGISGVYDVSVTYTVYNVYTAQEFAYAISTLCKQNNIRYKINLCNDIDMNGKSYPWTTANSAGTNSNVYIEGNGHTIYNLCIVPPNSDYSTGLFTNAPTHYIVKNLGFKSTFMLGGAGGQVGLLAAYPGTKLYFYNVHSDMAYLQTESTNDYGIGGLIGRKQGFGKNETKRLYSDNGIRDSLSGDNFFKNCSTSNCVIYGGSHVGGFSSWYGTVAESQVSYNAAFPEVPEKYVFTSDTATSNGSTGTITSGSSITNLATMMTTTYTSFYPIMIEDCYSVDCTIFSIGADSGAFVSCGSGILARNSFTNNTIFANNNTGGFVGRIATKEGARLKDDNAQMTINSSFDGCYSTGVVEGCSAMGGFIGLDNGYREYKPSAEDGTRDENFYGNNYTSAIVYNDCYSTAMVGMDYAGKYCGGFIGLDDNYNGINGTINGYKFDGGYDFDTYRGDLYGDIQLSNQATIKLSDDSAESTESGESTDSTKLISGNGSFYINCYSAGEVGNILTITDIDNAVVQENSFFSKNYHKKATSGLLDYYPTGGFIGAVGLNIYNTDSNMTQGVGNFFNCFYDMQTTAMRELAVGLDHVKVDNSSATNVVGDNFSLSGVKGLYTQTSEVKGIDGLTDMNYMDVKKGNSSDWEYSSEYYPQLSVFMTSDLECDDIKTVDSSSDNYKRAESSSFFIEENNNSAVSSHPVLSLAGAGNTSVVAAQMTEVVKAYRYSQASTATVLLNHWDDTMTASGNVGKETEWQPGLPQNRMEKTGEKMMINGEEVDVWKISYTGLAADTYDFKIQAGTSKAFSYGADKFDGDNISLTVDNDNTNVDIYFAYSDLRSDYYYIRADLTTSGGKKESEVIHKPPTEESYTITPYTVAGSFKDNSWNPNSGGDNPGYVTTYTGSDGIYKYTFGGLKPEDTVNSVAGLFTFKITAGGTDNSWTPNWGKSGLNDGEDMSFMLSGETDVTITFDENTHFCSVTASDESCISNIEVGDTDLTYKGYSLVASSSVFTGYKWFADSSGVTKANDAAEAGAMTWNDELGHYTFEKEISDDYLDKSYGYKVIKDAVDSGYNRQFYIPKADASTTSAEVVFHYDPTLDDENCMWVTCKNPKIDDGIVQHAVFDSFVVAGDSGLTGFNWLGTTEGDEYQRAASAAGTMAYDSSMGYYEKTYSGIKKGTYSFKIVGGGLWSTGVDYGNADGGNYEITLNETADVTIYFDAKTQSSNKIFVKTTPDTALESNKYVVTGTKNLSQYLNISTAPYYWNKNEPLMKYNREEGLYELWVEGVKENDLAEPADESKVGNYSYSYKVIKQGVDSGSNITFRLGNYLAQYDLRFTYDEKTCKSNVEVYSTDDHTKQLTNELGDVIEYDPKPIFYSVLGEEALTGYNWASNDDAEADRAAAARAGRMKLVEDGDGFSVYSVTFPVSNIASSPVLTTLLYKVVANGTWESGVDYGTDDGGNASVVLSVPSDLTTDSGNVTIKFKLYDDGTYEHSYEAFDDEGNDLKAEVDESALVWHICGTYKLYNNNFAGITNPTVYDTVRDITSSFKFTCGLDSEERGLTWAIDDVRNSADSFKSSDEFDLRYEVDSNTVDGTFKQKVINLDVKAIQNENYGGGVKSQSLLAQYFVDDFAPGKQWLTVNTIGYGYANSYKQWKSDYIDYNNYQKMLEAYENLFQQYLQICSVAIYKGKNVNKDTLLEYLEYLKFTPGYENYYAGLVPGSDLLADKETLDKNKATKPESDPSISSQIVIGERNLRLIPSSYLEAGNDSQISVLQYADNAVSNAVTYYDNSNTDINFAVSNAAFGNSKKFDIGEISFSYYNFALTAGYLITDKIGLGIYEGTYQSQNIQKYDENKIRNDNDIEKRTANSYYAMSSVYNQKPKYSDTGNREGANLSINEFADQHLIGSSYESARTIVKIFKIKDSNGNLLDKPTIVNTESPKDNPNPTEYTENYKKWTGQADFTTKDVGTYEVRFYWTLSDGRYLEDSKYVNITAIEPGLNKSVNVQYDTSGNNTLTYTINYTNDVTDYLLDFSIVDVLPFKDDLRGYPDNSNTPLHSKIDSSFSLSSIKISQSGKSQIREVYYSQSEDIRNCITKEKDDGTVISNTEAAKTFGLTNEGYLGDESSWARCSNNANVSVKGYDEIINSYYSGSELTFENVNNVTGIAISGIQLARGQNVQVEFTVDYTGNVADVLVNNAFYYVKSSIGETLEGSDMCAPVSTTIVSRDLTGYAWYDGNLNSIVDENEPRIQNMGVELYQYVNSAYISTSLKTTTDESGFYSFKNISEGVYKVVFYNLDDDSKPLTLVKKEGSQTTNEKIDFNSLYNTNRFEERAESSQNEVGTHSLAASEIIGKDTEDNPLYQYYISGISLPSDSQVYKNQLSSNRNEKVDNYLYTKYYQNAGFIDQSIVEEYKYSINIKKVNDDEDSLEGVKFMLEYFVESSSNDGTSGTWYPVYFVEDNGTYHADNKEPKTKEVLDEEKINYIFTTNSDGNININGLFKAKYRIVEVETLNGYYKLQAPIEFDLPYAVNKASLDSIIKNGGKIDGVTFISSSTDYTNDEHFDFDDETNVYYKHISFKITNNKSQFTLPTTGNNGLFVYVIVGISVFCAAALLFVLSKRKNRKSRNK